MAIPKERRPLLLWEPITKRPSPHALRQDALKDEKHGWGASLDFRLVGDGKPSRPGGTARPQVKASSPAREKSEGQQSQTWWQ